MSNSQPPAHDALVISYLTLRKAVGLVAIVLPIILVAGTYLLKGTGLERSVSAYYHTVMRDVLVGTLWAIAVFLLSYRGYERKDDIAGDLACLFAIGTALFPTIPGMDATPLDRVIGGIHFGFAAAFFATLAYFSLVLFRKTDPSKPPTPQKIKRNRVYTICGYTILACIGAIGVVSLLPPTATVRQLNPVFWLEALAIWSFGGAWFTKGEGILADRNP